MSRIGKSPIPIPEKVNITLDGLAVTVKGPKGELKRTLPDGVTISQVDNTIVVALATTSGALVSAMVFAALWWQTWLRGQQRLQQEA